MAELRIHTYTAAEPGLFVNSYLVAEAGGKRAAFIGDLAFDGTHSYTADGHSGEWLQVLDKVAGDLAGMPLYPGHGSRGDNRLLDRLRQYLLMYREAVRRLGADAVAAELSGLAGLAGQDLVGSA